MSGFAPPLCALDPALERRRPLIWALLLALMAVGAWLRFRDLGREGFWYDEIFGAQWNSGSLAHLFECLRTDGWKPPLDYLIIRPFHHLSGGGEAIPRIPAAVWGSLLPLVLFAWVRAACGATAALGAAALLVFSPLHVRFSQDATPYSLHLLLTTLATALLWALTSGRVRGARWWAAYALALWAALWTLFLTPLVAAIHAVWIWGRWSLARRRRSPEAPRLRTAMLLALAIIGAGVASVAARILILTQVMGELSAEPLFPFAPWGPRDVVFNLGALTFGYEPGPHTFRTGLLALPVLLIGAWRLMLRETSLGALLLLMLAGTFAGVLAMCVLQDHWYAIRYVLPALPMHLALLAVGVATLMEAAARLAPARWRAHAAGALLLAALLGGGAWAVWALTLAPYQKLGWRAAGAWVAEHAGPHRPLMLTAPIQTFPMQHYLLRHWAAVALEVEETGEAMRARLAELPEAIICIDQWTLAEQQWRWLEELPEAPGVFHGLSLRLWRSDPEALRAALDAAAERALPRFEAAGRRFEIADETMPGLGTGWWSAEGEEGGTRFRWMAGHRATVHLPLEQPAPATLSFRAMAFGWPGAPPQTVTLQINGAVAGRGIVLPGWAAYAVDVPADLWRPGANLIELLAEHAHAPASVLESSDRRVLGIGVDWISLGEEAVDHDWTGTAPLGSHPALLARATRRFAEDRLTLDVGAEPFAALPTSEWHSPEETEGGFTMRWSAVPPAQITLPLAAPGAWDLRLRAMVFGGLGPPPHALAVEVNGQPAGAAALSGEWAVHYIPISGEPWQSGLNTLVLEIDRVASPAETIGVPDHRPLGLAVDWLQLMPRGAPAISPEGQ